MLQKLNLNHLPLNLTFEETQWLESHANIYKGLYAKKSALAKRIAKKISDSNSIFNSPEYQMICSIITTGFNKMKAKISYYKTKDNAIAYLEKCEDIAAMLQDLKEKFKLI